MDPRKISRTYNAKRNFDALLWHLVVKMESEDRLEPFIQMTGKLLSISIMGVKELNFSPTPTSFTDHHFFKISSEINLFYFLCWRNFFLEVR